MSGSELEARLAAHADGLRLLAAEADRRLENLERRYERLSTRSALIVSSAAVSAGLQSVSAPTLLQLSAIVMSLLSALVAVPSLLARRAREVNIDDLLGGLYQWEPLRLELEVLNVKRAILNEDERALELRTRQIRSAFVALALAIILTGLHVAVMTLGAGALVTAPTSIPTP